MAKTQTFNKPKRIKKCLYKNKELSDYNIEDLQVFVHNPDVLTEAEQTAIRSALVGWIHKNRKFFSLDDMSIIFGVPKEWLEAIVPVHTKRTLNVLRTQTLLLWKLPDPNS